MNFLAHFHLAWPDDGLIAGGLEGDFVKGPLRGQLPPQLERGVRLHRAIDAYTDSHPLIEELRRELPSHLRRYAGILIDLSFDHYLSIHWSKFSQVPLAEFNGAILASLRAQKTLLSNGARAMLARFAEHDVLNRYQSWEVVTEIAARLGERLGEQNPLLYLDQELAPARTRLEQCFLNFYPQLQSFSRCKALEREPAGIAPGAKAS